MKTNSARLPAAVPNLAFLVSLYALEFSALITAMAIYKKGNRLLQPFLMTPAGMVLVAGVVLLVVSILIILFQIYNGTHAWKQWLTAHLVLNLCSVALMLVAAEAVIRGFAVSTPVGPVFANTVLLPRSWEDIAARNQRILAKASVLGSYLVYDGELGWTIGPARHSKDYNIDLARRLLPGLRRRYPQNSPGRYPAEKRGSEIESDDEIYLSSVEGLRSPRAGMIFGEVPARRRIAIIGDSFTFGLEVRYEETWGHQLEIALGPEWQVLNFGVDGYGVDQAYLRYQRDVLSWHPEIVIFGVINDDLRRTMGVYGFLTFPQAEIPFPKPRFVVGEHGPVPLNLPLPTPESIFARDSITELPFIEYDGSFQRADWEWHLYDNLYSFRFLFSRYPRWPEPGPNVSDEAMRSVNGELLRSFVRLARSRGSTPIVVYFPARSDFVLEGTPQAGLTRVAREVFQAYGIRYLDMTDCVSKVNPPERFVTLHYSSVVNAAIARCLRDSIRALADVKRKPASAGSF